jgi:rhamnosyltransferase
MLSTRRLFFTDDAIAMERMLVAADAYVSPAVGETAKAGEIAALRAGQLLLTFDAGLRAGAARHGGQVGLLTDADLASSAIALSDWLARPDAERAQIAERTRQALDEAAVAGIGQVPAVVAVVVTHRPRLDALSELLAALAPQVSSLVLVDNHTEPPLGSWLKEHGPANVHPIFLDDNHGVAAAQNAGIAKARELGAGYVLLSDQDSVPEPDMVARLRAALQAKQAEGVAVAAVGPQYRDPRGGSGAFVRLRGLRYEHRGCQGEGDLVETDHLIASGCLIPMAVIERVGGMTEELFIDYVDTEWALRARRQGYRSFGVCAARMRHDRGNAPRNLFGRTIPMHDPLRHYYQNRNAVWLCRQDWLPLQWKLANCLRLLRNLVVYSLLPGPRLERLRMTALGLWHGWRGRMGRR